MVYATSAELEDFTGVTAPDDADRLLARASELVDYATRQRVDPNNADHLAAAQKATCAIVENWTTNGELVSSTTGDVQSYSLGKFSVSYTGGGSASTASNPATSTGGMGIRAYQYLQSAGLLSAGVTMV